MNRLPVPKHGEIQYDPKADSSFIKNEKMLYIRIIFLELA